MRVLWVGTVLKPFIPVVKCQSTFSFRVWFLCRGTWEIILSTSWSVRFSRSLIDSPSSTAIPPLSQFYSLVARKAVERRTFYKDLKQIIKGACLYFRAQGTSWHSLQHLLSRLGELTRPHLLPRVAA